MTISWRLSILLGFVASTGCIGSYSRSNSTADYGDPCTEPASPVAATSTMEARSTQQHEPPFLVHEAALPKEFPPAGPIGAVIIKSYPPFRMAKVNASATPKGSDDQMFRVLFNHIQKENLAMTAPVVMGFAQPSELVPRQPVTHPPTSMGFAYADLSVGKTETDGDVVVEDQPAVTVLSIGVRGAYDHVRFDDGMKAIGAFLKQHPREFELIGSPRFLGYNSPLVPWFMRYGEVQLPVRAR